MSDTLEQLFDQSSGTFGQAMEGVAKDEHGHFTPEYREWHAVRNIKPNLDAAAEQFESGVEAIRDKPMLPADHKARMVADAKYLYDVAEAQAVKDFQAGIARVKAGLQGTYASKVHVAENPADRQLVREEIAQTVQMVPRGQTVTRALQLLVESDPARYVAELSGPYGANLMKLHGEPENHGAIARLGLALLPDTGKSQPASAALSAMQASRIEGMALALRAPARARVDAALAPKAQERGVYRPDTIRPIR